MLCCIAMVAKYLDLNKPWSCKYGRKNGKKNDVYDFPVHDRAKRYTILSSIVRQCKYQERLLRCRKFATMVR